MVILGNIKEEHDAMTVKMRRDDEVVHVFVMKSE